MCVAWICDLVYYQYTGHVCCNIFIQKPVILSNIRTAVPLECSYKHAIYTSIPLQYGAGGHILTCGGGSVFVISDEKYIARLAGLHADNSVTQSWQICLINWAPHYEETWQSGGLPPHILHFIIGWRLLDCQGKSFWFPLENRLIVLKCQFGIFGESSSASQTVV